MMGRGYPDGQKKEGHSSRGHSMCKYSVAGGSYYGSSGEHKKKHLSSSTIPGTYPTLVEHTRTP